MLPPNPNLSQKDNQTLQKLTQQIKQLYKQLKNCSHPPIQTTIIWSLKPKCQEVLAIMDKSDQGMRKRQIVDILDKVCQLERRIQDQEGRKPEIGNGGRRVKLATDQNYTQADLQAELGHKMQLDITPNPNHNHNPKQQQQYQQQYQQYRPPQQPPESTISRASLHILKNIAIQQIKSINLNYTNEELNEVLKRLQDNQEVMESIEDMIVKQGHDVDKVEENIQKVYQNVGEVNQELTEAEKEQVKAVNKIRKAFQKSAMGFWGIVTWPFKKIFRRNKTTPTSTPTSTP